MPYGVSNTRPDCSGWATVKKNSDGSFETVACHDTKQDAIDQMVAVSISEKVEPLGDVSRRSRDKEVVAVDMDETMVTKSRYPIREVVDAVNRLAHRVIVVTGREEAQREQTINDLEYAGIGYDGLLMLPELGQDIAAFKRDAVQELMREYEVIAFIDDNEDNRDAVESLGVYVLTPEEFVEAARESGLFDEDEDEDEPEEEELEFETREVNRVAPGFMAASARRGLRLHEEGHSGDGLMPATVADARRMADGEPLSAAKWRRIPGWIARHMMDLDAVEGDEITPGLVAMLLWGGGSSKSSARRAQAYAERIVKQLEGDELRYDPLQPRGPDGKWTSGGGGGFSGDVNTGDAGGGAAAGGGSAGAAAGADAPRAPRPGMGDIPLDSHTVMKMRGGSAEKHLVTLPDGTVQFTPEREALHDAIVKDALDGVPPSANPTFHMMGGGAAAGKSSMVRSGAVEVPGKGQAAQLNVDDTRKALPEYGQMTAAGDRNSSAFTHEEASYVTKRAQQAAFERKLDVVLDGTGNSSVESLNKKIDTARANGYEVKGYYATVPIATAIARSDARATNPMSPDFGRFVAPDVLTVQHQSVARVLPAVAPRFDSVRLFDTSGDTPRLLMQGGKGSVTVVDQAGYNAFLAIGGD